MNFLKSLGYFFMAMLVFYSAQYFINAVKYRKKTFRNYLVALFLSIIGIWLFYEAATHMFMDYENSPIIR